MSTAIQHQRIFVLEEISCGECGIAFAVDSRVRAKWVREGSWFYCPNGHKIHYSEHEVDRLRKQLEAAKNDVAEATKRELFAKANAQAERAAREHTERRLTARKGINTRLRNRIKNGVCPCCHRSFENLRRHMSTQHPQFHKDDGE